MWLESYVSGRVQIYNFKAKSVNFKMKLNYINLDVNTHDIDPIPCQMLLHGEHRASKYLSALLYRYVDC
jgi:hypothetical protein